MKSQNPFQNDDWFGQVVGLDKDVQLNAKKTYKNFELKYYQQSNNWLMTRYLKTVHFITTNAIAATAVMLISLTTLSASAAQILAPEEYKPANIANKIFKNQQKETNPYTSLKADEDNDVVIYNQCNLAIKYPRKLQQFEVKARKFTLQTTPESQSLVESDNGEQLDIGINGDSPEAQAWQTEIDQEIANLSPKSKAEIEEVLANKYPTFFSYHTNCGQESFNTSKDNMQPITNDQLREMTGWFITEAKMEEMFASTIEDKLRLAFKFENKYYLIHTQLRSSNPKNIGLFGNQIQLQFNSLVQNEANAQIVENSSTSSAQSGQSSSVDSNSSSQAQSAASEINNSSELSSMPTGISSANQASSQTFDGLQTRVLVWNGETEDYTLLREYKRSEKGGMVPHADYYTANRPEFTNRKSTGGALPEFRIKGKIGPNYKSFADKFVKYALEISLVQSVEQTNVLDLSPSGYIRGQLIYPSNYLHPQTVCAKNIQTGVKTCDYFTQEDYGLKVAPGDYQVYSFPDKIEPAESNLVHFDKFVVECMMKSPDSQPAICDPNSLTEQEKTVLKEKIVVSVKVGETQGNINPQNWYVR